MKKFSEKFYWRLFSVFAVILIIVTALFIPLLSLGSGVSFAVLVSLGLGHEAMAGSSGNSTYLRGKSGCILKVRKSPSNPRTEYQVSLRSQIASIASMYKSSAMDSYRQAWIDMAAIRPRTNKFGKQVFVTGLDWFVDLSLARVQTGWTLAAWSTYELPVQFLPGDVSITVTKTGTPAISMAYTGGPGSDNFSFQIWMSKAVSNGRMYPKNVCVLCYKDTDETSPIDLKSLYEARFETIGTAGKRVHWKVRCIHKSSGENMLFAQGSSVIG